MKKIYILTIILIILILIELIFHTGQKNIEILLKKDVPLPVIETKAGIQTNSIEDVKEIEEKKFELDTIENIKNKKIHKRLDFSVKNEKAEKIFLDFLANEIDLTPEKCTMKSFCYAKAVEVDLNDNGINEIIGWHGTFCGTIGCTGYILQKQKNKWTEIGFFNFYPGENIDILKNKTEGYYDIRTFAMNEFKEPMSDVAIAPYILKYKNNSYNTKCIYQTRKEQK